MSFRHIIKNKQIILAVIILCLAMIFIFALEELGAAESPASPMPNDEFVIKSQENEIQPTDAEDRDFTNTDSIIFEKSMAEAVFCGNKLNYPPAGSIDYLPPDRINAPILMYHYVDEPGTTTLPWLFHPPAVFDAQLKTLYNNCYRSVFVSDVAEAINGNKSLPAKSIAITFDDGYEDMYTRAYPLLKKYNMKGTMYIIANALGKPGYLTPEQVKEMSDSGLVEIASHTLNHANLRQANWDKARYEISASKSALEKIIDRPITDFAYPYGFFTSRDEDLCRQAGYLSCASTYPGQVQTHAKRFSLYRLRPGYRVGQSLINWLESAGPKR